MRLNLLAVRLIKNVVPLLVSFLLGYHFSTVVKTGEREKYNSRILQVLSPVAGARVELVVLILSAPANLEERSRARETWLRVSEDTRRSVKHLFVVGTEGLPSDIQKEVDRELTQHGDILALPLVDSYQALTEKVLQSLVQIWRNVNFNYVLKCDDDTFVDLVKLIAELRSQPYNDKLYWGFFDGRAPVQSKGKWAEPSYHLCDKYIPYALGGGYVLSRGLVSFIATNSERLQLYNSEDTSVGTWLAGLSVDRRHDVRFDTEWKSRGCSNKFLVTHKQSPGEMTLKWKRLVNSGLICDGVETKVRLSYNYNWSLPPSQCCVRSDHSLP